MSTISKPYTFSPNTTASSSQVNADFDTLYNDYNGNISAANLATGAVSTAKIADDAVTVDKIADNAVGTAQVNDAAVTPIKWTNPYKFRAYRNAAANSGASSAYAQIVFDTENYDSNSNFASGTYTAPVAGFYHFSWRAKVTTGGAEQFESSLFKNGSVISQGLNISAAGVEHVTSTGSDDIQLAANDTVDVRCFSSGTARALETGTTATYFSGHIISQT